MMGIVFSEFVDMVEDSFSADTVDALMDLAEAQFESKGAYTSVGNYPHSEMISLVSELSRHTDVPITRLVQIYGQHLFSRFSKLYPMFFVDTTGSIEFLETIESHIHTEVRKLYPQAELPYFDCVREGPDRLLMEYSSDRPFAPLALGLIEGCVAHFGDLVNISMTDHSKDGKGSASFVLVRESRAVDGK